MKNKLLDKWKISLLFFFLVLFKCLFALSMVCRAHSVQSDVYKVIVMYDLLRQPGREEPLKR